MKSQASKPRALSWPRQYAAAIIEAAGDVPRQREIFEACPLEWRAQVRELAKRGLEKAEQLRQHHRLIRSAVERDPGPLVHPRRVTELKKSSPELGRQHLAAIRAAIGHQEYA